MIAPHATDSTGSTDSTDSRRLIGIDTGGTFTDAVTVDAAGSVTVGKALSTPGRVDDGVFAAIRVLADRLGVTVEKLLAGTTILAHGTTVGLNALLTRKGARVGLLTTAGFESTLAIAKAAKLFELAPADLRSPSQWRTPQAPVDRADIRGVVERIDVTGAVVTELDDAAARAAITELVGAGVRSLAISLLWSPVNPRHERRLRELAAEIAPGLPVSLSSEVAPRIGEYERTTTTVIDAYTGPLVVDYLDRMHSRLRENGFDGQFVVMRMAGGVQPVEAARRSSVQTLRSGPAGGVSASRQLGLDTQRPNLIATDVGGTSFDVGLVIAGEPYSAGRPSIDRLPLAVPAVDIPSIGTGGGSIAWIDPALGTLRVGPESATADPGPACYGRGGKRPTLTDAAVALGYVERLGGSLDLDRGAALQAIRTHIAEPLGVDLTAAAEGIVQVATSQMRDLVRRTTIERGHDPAEFALVAYGGAGPQYVGRYALDLGIRDVVVPALAAEFSAFGALSSDLRVTAEAELPPAPLDEAAMASIAAALATLEPQASAQLGDGAVRLQRSVGLRFYRQLHRIDVAVPDDLDGLDPDAVRRRFFARYEQLVGPGSAPSDSPVELVAVTVEATRSVVVPAAVPRPSEPAIAHRHRAAWFNGGAVDCEIFDWELMAAGQTVAGPCFLESDQTTVVVYPGLSARVSASGDITLRPQGAPA